MGVLKQKSNFSVIAYRDNYYSVVGNTNDQMHVLLEITFWGFSGYSELAAPDKKNVFRAHVDSEHLDKFVHPHNIIGTPLSA